MANIESLKAMRIGCDNVVWAELLTDDGVSEPTWGTIYNLPGEMVMSVNPNVSLETAFYDDGPGEVASTLGNIEVSFDKSVLGPLERSYILGKVYDANGVLWHGSNDVPKWGALGFRSLKSDGTYRYVWLHKGKFTEPNDESETKGDSINFQNDQITGRFVKLNYEYTVTDTKSGSDVVMKLKPWKIEVDGADSTIDSLNTKWFEQVVTPTTDFSL